MALIVSGLSELFTILAVFLLSAAFLLGVVVMGVRIALAFITHPESEEMQKRVALLEREVDRLEARLEEDEPDHPTE